VTIPPVDEHTGERRQDQRGDLPKKTDDAEQEYRTAEPVYQPTGGNPRNPGADEGNCLAAEEESVVPMVKRAREVWCSARTLMRFAMCGRHDC